MRIAFRGEVFSGTKEEVEGLLEKVCLAGVVSGGGIAIVGNDGEVYVPRIKLFSLQKEGYFGKSESNRGKAESSI